MPRFEECPLGNADIKFIDGDRSKRYPKREEYVENGIMFLNAESINSGFVDLTSVNFVSEQKYSEIKKGRIRKNDVLMTTRGNGIGDVAFVNTDRKGLINAQMLILRTYFKKVYPKYLFYYLSSDNLHKYVLNFASGAAQPQIPIRDLRKIPISFPNLPIQKKIAAVLSSYDDLIENNKRRIALLEKMAEEIYREWFVRFRFPGYKKVRFIKGIPEGWNDSTLGKIADFTMGQSPKSEYYNEKGDGLPFNQGVGTYGNRFPQKKSFCSVNGRKAKKGDILFSVRAPVGRLNIADCDMIIGRGLCAMRHKEELNSYLFYLLKVTFSNEDIIGNGAIFNSVAKDELKNFNVLSPKNRIVLKFNNIAAEIDNQISLITASLENLISTRDLLLPRLISGKLSVEDLDIQFPPSMKEEASHEI